MPRRLHAHRAPYLLGRQTVARRSYLGAVHVPQLRPRFDAHAVAVARVVRRAPREQVDAPSGVPLLHHGIALEPATRHDDAFFGLDGDVAAGAFGDDAEDFLRLGILHEAFRRRGEPDIGPFVDRDFVEVPEQLRTARIAAFGPGHFAGHARGIAVIAPNPVDFEVLEGVEPRARLDLLLDDGGIQHVAVLLAHRPLVEMPQHLHHAVGIVGLHAGLDAARRASQVAAVGLARLLQRDHAQAGVQTGDGGGHASRAVPHHDDVGFLVPRLGHPPILLLLRGSRPASDQPDRSGSHCRQPCAFQKTPPAELFHRSSFDPHGSCRPYAFDSRLDAFATVPPLRVEPPPVQQ